MLHALITIIVSLMNIISASMYIDLYNKHTHCIKDDHWKKMKKYMIFVLISGIVGFLMGGYSMFKGSGNKGE